MNSVYFYGKILGGEEIKTKESIARVNFWVLPGGYDVKNAQAVDLYFDSLELAEELFKRFENSNSMPFIEYFKDTP